MTLRPRHVPDYMGICVWAFNRELKGGFTPGMPYANLMAGLLMMSRLLTGRATLRVTPPQLGISIRLMQSYVPVGFTYVDTFPFNGLTATKKEPK